MKGSFFLLWLGVFSQKDKQPDFAGQFPLSDYVQVYNEYLLHFRKSYPAEEKERRLGFFKDRLSPLLVSNVPLAKQLPFSGLQREEAVVLPYSVIKHSCNQKYSIFKDADWSPEELTAAFSPGMNITKQHFQEGQRSIEKFFPEAASMLRKMNKDEQSPYAEILRRKALENNDLTGSSKEDSKGKLLNKIFPVFNGTMGAPPPPLPNQCSMSGEQLKPKKRMLIGDGLLIDKFTTVSSMRVRFYANYELYVRRVKKQGNCRACYAFTAIDLFSSMYHMFFGKKIKPSVQEAIDCTPNKGCESGDITKVFDYINLYGISDENRYPYISHDGVKRDCTPSSRRYRAKINYYPVYPYVHSAIEALQFGPFILPIYVSSGLDALKHQKIFYGTDCDFLNPNQAHVVYVFGYQILEEPYYFIAKNSWGKEWGDEGYFQLAFPSTQHNTPVPCALPVLGFRIQINRFK